MQEFLDGDDLQNSTIVNNLEFGFLARSPEAADVGRPKPKREDSGWPTAVTKRPWAGLRTGASASHSKIMKIVSTFDDTSDGKMPCHMSRS